MSCNQHDTAVSLSITLEHDDGVVRARGWLKGKVDITSTANDKEGLSLSHSIAAGELQVDLVGKELAVVPPHGILNGIRNLLFAPSATKRKEASIFAEHRVLQDFTMRPLVGGCASCPFSIYLPGTLPSSMDFEDKEGRGSCSVHYRLTARIAMAQPLEKQEPQPAIVTTELNNCMVKTEHPLFVVGETLSHKKYPYILRPTCFPLNSHGLFNKGYVTLAARVENTHVSKGGSLDFSLACRNKSRRSVQRVDVHLIEEIQWTDSACAPTTNGSSNENNEDQFAMSRTVTLGSCKNLQMDSLRMECWDLTKDPLPLSTTEPPEVDVLTVSEMHNCLSSQNNLVHIRLPSTARESYTGKLIKVSHYLQIALVFKSKHGCDPVLKIPIKVFDQPIEDVNRHHSLLREKIDITLSSAKWQDEDAVTDHRAALLKGMLEDLRRQ